MIALHIISLIAGLGGVLVGVKRVYCIDYDNIKDPIVTAMFGAVAGSAVSSIYQYFN